MKSVQELLDEVLVLQCQAGGAQAFERIVSRYGGRLRYFLRRMLGPRRDVDDACQEVWLAAFRELRKLRNPAAFRVWLYRIARNRAYQVLRDERRALPTLDVSDVADDVEGEEFSPEEAGAIHRGLEKLRAEHKEILMLRFLEDMPYQVIAETIGCSPGTVRSRIHYAKRALRREMEASGDEQNR